MKQGPLQAGSGCPKPACTPYGVVNTVESLAPDFDDKAHRLDPASRQTLVMRSQLVGGTFQVLQLAVAAEFFSMLPEL